MNTERLTKAISFAARAHEGQTYHGILNGSRCEYPYLFHALRVMMRCLPHAWVVAVLHDVLEDHGEFPPMELVTLEELEALELLTRDKKTDSYEAYIDRIHEARGRGGILAREVKLADLSENLENLPSVVKKERYIRAYWQLSGGRFWTDHEGRKWMPT